MKIPLADLHRQAKRRPRGYVQDVLAHADRVDDTHYWLSGPSYAKLLNKYRRLSTAQMAAEQRRGWLKAATRVGRGVAGLAKSIVRADRAQEDVIAARSEICDACRENVPCIKPLRARCCGRLLDVLKPTAKTCGCILSRKKRVAKEWCPLGKW